MGELPDIKGWVEVMAGDLVDRPEAVEVQVVEEEGATVFELAVDEHEMGRVIGRQGRTAEALRILLDVAGAKHRRNYELEILE